jgi:hypothetical protein
MTERDLKLWITAITMIMAPIIGYVIGGFHR